ncbi:MAG: hypothetical protein WD472_03610 [Dehalococcoidia bacterium]
MDLEGVSAQDLSEFSIRLEPPASDDRPAFDEDRVMEVARKEQSDAIVREVVLARVHVQSELVKDGQLVWVVNWDPATVHPFPRLGPGPGSDGLDPYAGTDPNDRHVFLALFFVDAQTGAPLFGVQSAQNPEQVTD